MPSERVDGVHELQRLRRDHADAVLRFEVANRTYFAEWISDRGDEYFDRFTERFRHLLDDQAAGVGAFHVLVAPDGAVLGRFNLRFRDDASAELGYRVARTATGRGLATAAVGELCETAAERYGLRRIRAVTSLRNTASQRVLTQAGFLPVGAADPADLGGEPGTWYERVLVDQRGATGAQPSRQRRDDRGGGR